MTDETDVRRVSAARAAAKDAVDAAIVGRRLAPSQRAWAETYATTDLKGFQTFVAGAMEVFPELDPASDAADEAAAADLLAADDVAAVAAREFERHAANAREWTEKDPGERGIEVAHIIATIDNALPYYESGERMTLTTLLKRFARPLAKDLRWLTAKTVGSRVVEKQLGRPRKRLNSRDEFLAARNAARAELRRSNTAVSPIALAVEMGISEATYRRRAKEYDVAD